MTPYAKTPKTNEEIADILEVRGLAFDRGELLAFLSRVGYYRLKGYLVPFRKPQDVCFQDKTEFATVRAIYEFDASLRSMLSEGLATVEVAVRALLIRYHLEVNPDPFAYTTAAGLPGLKPKAYAELMKHIGDAVAKAKMEPFMKHLAVEHGITSNPPLWTMMEVVPFGSLVCYFQGLPDPAKQKVANTFYVTPSVLVGFLNALRRMRNVCAHHARLWNRKTGSMVSRKIGQREELKPLDEAFIAYGDPAIDSVFVLMSVVRYLVSVIHPNSAWLAKSRTQVEAATPFVLRGMGFPVDWQELALWK